MDYSPRRIMAMVREGFRNETLGSKTIWLCASCYSCTVHCPQDIHITDVMYTLKRDAIEHKKYPKRFPVPVLAQEFGKIVEKNGRNSEAWLVLRMALRSNPLILFKMLRTGWDLIRTGRMKFGVERIKRRSELPRYLASDGNGNGKAV
jgi:heterodisulfide reductase subunit C